MTEARRSLKTHQRAEAMALGVGWSDDRLVAVHEDGTPLRPESYTDEFQRLRARAGLRRIRLHGLRNTSVSLMLDQGHPPQFVAAWHGHDPAVALHIYADVKADELRAVGASLFGRPGLAAQGIRAHRRRRAATVCCYPIRTTTVHGTDKMTSRLADVDASKGRTP